MDVAKTILVIHGGNIYTSREEYIGYLRTKPVDLDRMREHAGWKDTLQEKMGATFDVLTPRMPMGDNARYEEWSMWFERILDTLTTPIILVGHSLGGLFLAKYVSTQILTKRVEALVLVAAPFRDLEDQSAAVSGFALDTALTSIQDQTQVIHLMHSTDDTVVSYADMHRYEAALPAAVVHSYTDKGHFLGPSPEIVELLSRI